MSCEIATIFVKMICLWHLLPCLLTLWNQLDMHLISISARKLNLSEFILLNGLNLILLNLWLFVIAQLYSPIILSYYWSYYPIIIAWYTFHLQLGWWGISEGYGKREGIIKSISKSGRARRKYASGQEQEFWSKNWRKKNVIRTDQEW